MRKNNGPKLSVRSLRSFPLGHLISIDVDNIRIMTSSASDFPRPVVMKGPDDKFASSGLSDLLRASSRLMKISAIQIGSNSYAIIL